MPATPGVPRLDQIAHNWLRFSERRLAYYAELYRSGRWRHYYSRDEFAARLRDVVGTVKAWRQLAGETPLDAKSDLRPAA